MKIFGIFVALLALACLGWLIDPINFLQLRLLTNPMWENGFSAIVRLPPDASPEEVVRTYWLQSKPKLGGSPHRILETKSMWLLAHGGSHGWTAAWVDGPEGREIVVMIYQPQGHCWSVRPEE